MLSDIVESGFALPGPFYLSDHPIDTDQALSLLVAADSNNLAPFEIHAISIEIEGNDGGGAAAVGTILNDDYATLSIGDATVTEGGDLVFNATLTNPVDVDTVITYSTADGSATTADSDYAGQTAQTLTIPAGQTSGTITVATTADNQVELDETLDVNLTAVSAGGRAVSILDGTGEGTIENDDSATLSIADTMVFEGDAGDSNQLVFNLTLDNPVDVPISVDYRTENGTATTADSDYAGIGITSLSIAAGDTSAQIVVDVTGDGKVEYDETLQMVLDNLNALGRDVSLAGTGTTSNPLELLDFQNS